MVDISTPQKNTPPDWASTGYIWFYVETFRIFQSGLKKLYDKISIFDKVRMEFDLTATSIEKDILYLKKLIDWGDELLQAHNDPQDEVDMNINYRHLRYFKAGGLIELQEYKDKRNRLISEHNVIPKKLLSAIDERIAKMSEMLEQGLMKDLEPSDIFIELTSLEQKPEKQELSKQPIIQYNDKLVFIDEIPILDQELKTRCLDLLKQFEEKQEIERFDTVVREISTILEDRVRKIAGINDKSAGVKLMSSAFAGDKPKLVFSGDSDIQESAHLLFRGYVGFFRNESMHNLVSTFSYARVYQLLGYVDYLLFLLTQARKQTESSPEEPLTQASS